VDCVVSSEPRCDMAETPRWKPGAVPECYYCDQAPGPASGAGPSHRVEDFCASWSNSASRICPCVAASSPWTEGQEQEPAAKISLTTLAVVLVGGVVASFTTIYSLCRCLGCCSSQMRPDPSPKHSKCVTTREPEEEPTWVMKSKAAKPKTSPTKKVLPYRLEDVKA